MYSNFCKERMLFFVWYPPQLGKEAHERLVGVCWFLNPYLHVISLTKSTYCTCICNFSNPALPDYRDFNGNITTQSQNLVVLDFSLFQTKQQTLLLFKKIVALITSSKTLALHLWKLIFFPRLTRS